MTAATTNLAGERADLAKALQARRQFLCRAAQGLSDEQIRARSTVSELCIGGIVKHVTYTERRWIAFAQHGPSAMTTSDDRAAAFAAHLATFQLEAGDSIESLIADYEAAAAETDLVIGSLSLDATQPLPSAPWFEPNAR